MLSPPMHLIVRSFSRVFTRILSWLSCTPGLIINKKFACYAELISSIIIKIKSPYIKLYIKTMSSDSFSYKESILGLGRRHGRRSNQRLRTSLLAEAAQLKKEALYKVYLEDNIPLSIQPLI